MPIETPTLEGTLIRLEPLSLDHLPALERVALDERIWRYMLVWVRTPEELRAWVEAALAQGSTGTQMAWVTVLRKTGEVIGSSRFLELDLRHQTVEVGHTWIAPAFEGTGVNSEVKLLQFHYAFETLGLRRVALKTHHENLHSQAAIRAIGGVPEGTFRNHYVMPDGSQRHSVWFSITREEWPEVRSRLEARLALRLGQAGPGSRPSA
jgi:RimJ/RimL family protein N-acetyltransferase